MDFKNDDNIPTLHCHESLYRSLFYHLFSKFGFTLWTKLTIEYGGCNTNEIYV